MKIPVLSLANEKVDEVDLPKVFETPLKPDVIRRAVIAQQSHDFQPQGRDPMAGKHNTALSRGTGHGQARLPRLKQSGKADLPCKQSADTSTLKIGESHSQENQQEGRRLAIRSYRGDSRQRGRCAWTNIEGVAQLHSSRRRIEVSEKKDVGSLHKDRIWADVSALIVNYTRRKSNMGGRSKRSARSTHRHHRGQRRQQSSESTRRRRYRPQA
jgi:hypothetical protein